MRQTRAREGGAASAVLAVAVEDGEEVEARISLEIRVDEEAVLVFSLREVCVEASLRDVGVAEEETRGGGENVWEVVVGAAAFGLDAAHSGCRGVLGLLFCYLGEGKA